MLGLLSASFRHASSWARLASTALVPIVQQLSTNPAAAQSAATDSSLVDEPKPASRSIGGSESSRTIILVRSYGDDSVIGMVRAELHDRGWRTMDVREKDPAAGTESLASIVADYAVAAALRFNAESQQIQLRISRKSGDIDETLHSPEDSSDARILAMRATETLRAHGLVLAPEATPAVAPPVAVVTQPQPRKLPVPQPERSRNLWLELGPAVLGSPGGASPTAGIWVGLRLELSPLWSLQTTGSLPLMSHTVRGTEGSSSVSTGVIGASIAATWLTHSLGSAKAGLGYALLITKMHGDARPGYLDRTEVVVTQAPYALLRLALLPFRNWECFLAMQGGLSIPEISVAFAEHQRETWGRPFLLAGLGLSLRSLTW